ncbi:MAG TPA: hypothetical protein DGB32_04595 [Dehalococcoidia bacterium]|nr:hypothetical protein [Dehalococcoidia bacterium]
MPGEVEHDHRLVATAQQCRRRPERSSSEADGKPQPAGADVRAEPALDARRRGLVASKDTERSEIGGDGDDQEDATWNAQPAQRPQSAGAPQGDADLVGDERREPEDRRPRSEAEEDRKDPVSDAEDPVSGEAVEGDRPEGGVPNRVVGNRSDDHEQRRDQRPDEPSANPPLEVLRSGRAGGKRQADRGGEQRRRADQCQASSQPERPRRGHKPESADDGDDATKL